MKTITTQPPKRSPDLNRSGLKRSARSGTPSPVVELVPALLKLKSILVPIDFSPASEKALVYAVSFARQFGAKLDLLHVVEPVPLPECARALENDHLVVECKTHLQRVLKDLNIDPALVEKTTVRSGRAFHEIAEAARLWEVDLIIIATHGYGRIKHALLGSTSERVVQYAPCPVLVVRPHEREFV